MAKRNAYDLLAPIANQLAESRQYYELQLNLLTSLFEKYGTSRESKILDAATGTGRILRALYDSGYRNLYGIDGSESMLEQMQPHASRARVKRVDWEEIDEAFQGWGAFDFIYFLGHSLPHLEADRLPSLFRSVHSHLVNGGLLVFDMREWEADADGVLKQPGRKENEWRWLIEVAFRGQPFQLYDTVSYSGGRQTVTYRLASGGDSSECHEESLEYCTVAWPDVAGMLRDAGFNGDDLEMISVEPWPYAVVVARKT